MKNLLSVNIKKLKFCRIHDNELNNLSSYNLTKLSFDLKLVFNKSGIHYNQSKANFVLLCMDVQFTKFLVYIHFPRVEQSTLELFNGKNWAPEPQFAFPYFKGKSLYTFSILAYTPLNILCINFWLRAASKIAFKFTSHEEHFKNFCITMR
ncbi:hypothetical protein Anas_14459 [Armadillidium nasatum]|uniref:Uncharacterized protein n=1 Tax=Armadillidium nasatum TaxID=96803 RepID=A0A5N5TF90_9CRUS|nr:hypothetical protein Anas_14459 [Armadillidium nasatum]